MSDKLGEPGHAHEHDETLDAAYANVRAGRASNWIALLAVIVSGVSALFAWLTYQNSNAELKQNRETLLLRDRITACLDLEEKASALNSEATNVHFRLVDLPGRDFDRFTELRRVSNAWNELRASMRLEYLGPASLANAEGDLDDAAMRVALPFLSGGELPNIDRQELERRTSDVIRASVALRMACVQAVGSYRVAPGDREEPTFIARPPPEP